MAEGKQGATSASPTQATAAASPAERVTVAPSSTGSAVTASPPASTAASEAVPTVSPADRRTPPAAGPQEAHGPGAPRRRPRLAGQPGSPAASRQAGDRGLGAIPASSGTSVHRAGDLGQRGGPGRSGARAVVDRHPPAARRPPWRDGHIPRSRRGRAAPRARPAGPPGRRPPARGRAGAPSSRHAAQAQRQRHTPATSTTRGPATQRPHPPRAPGRPGGPRPTPARRPRPAARRSARTGRVVAGVCACAEPGPAVVSVNATLPDTGCPSADTTR